MIMLDVAYSRDVELSCTESAKYSKTPLNEYNMEFWSLQSIIDVNHVLKIMHQSFVTWAPLTHGNYFSSSKSLLEGPQLSKRLVLK